MELGTVPGIETMVAKFTTDIPALTNWGVPLLIGPGSIQVAHTAGEYIEKKQLLTPSISTPRLRAICWRSAASP